MKKIKATLICTVFNERENIAAFLDSVISQSEKPDEIIIVDGGSKDSTLSIIKNKIKANSKRLTIKLYIKKGNRSIGRNEAVKKSSHEIILCTDSGCLLDKDWVKNIKQPFEDKNIDVVAGYYDSKPGNIFQKCLVPYVLVMKDKVNRNEFLPATRSMAFKKQVWEKLKGFNEKLSHNEDFDFANRIKKNNFSIFFEEKAIVHWIPRKNIFEAFKMFFRFSLGDIEANLIRDKVIYLFLRYLFAVYLVLLSVIMKSIQLYVFDFILLISYIAWSVYKNYRYVKDMRAFVFLPLLQFTSDIAVISGTSIGIIKKFSLNRLREFVINNKSLILIILSYVFLLISTISYGIPNNYHPFTYHMDEWHFSQALRTFLEYGTGSYSGAASIPLYHIVSTLVFLTPFYLLKIIDPFLIRSSIENLSMQHTLFEILRLHTLLYGVLSITVIFNILKKFIKLNPLLFTALFIFNPIFLLLSGFYKYDITLIFWINVTIYFLFKFNNSQKLSDYIFAGIACGLSLSTKFTAAPLLVGYVLSYFIFSREYNIKKLLISVSTVILFFVLVGIPDMILGKGNYFGLLSSTLIEGPKASLAYNLELSPQLFLILKQFPSMFGYFLITLFYISFVFHTLFLGSALVKKTLGRYRVEIFLYLLTLLFLLSTVSFGIDGGGNRALVLLPFIVLLSATFLTKLKEKIRYKNIFYFILILGFVLQVVQSYSWLALKFSNDPRKTSSEWILKNIPKKSSIGIENIPIYQMLPDFVLKEFYAKQYNPQVSTKYSYKVISVSDKTFPRYIIITNDFENVKYLKISPKKDLVKKINSLNYKQIKNFEPTLLFYNLFSDKLYLIITNIYPVPANISIYEKI